MNKNPIKLFTVNMPKSVDGPLLETLHSGYITQGKKVEEFEELLQDYLGDLHVVTLNSCTSAITLALRLAGVGPGDEVVTTAMTCTATNLPIVTAGAKPVFCDIDSNMTGNVSLRQIKDKVTDKTKAIVIVDWGGLPVTDAGTIKQYANSKGIKLIEDAAHAFGAVRHVADYTCYSLQAIKHITTGDGGVLVCRDPANYDRARKLRWYGISRDADSLDSRITEDITEAGYKFHMNDIAATIGIEQLKTASDNLAVRMAVANFYKSNLLEHLTSDTQQASSTSAHWIYTILIDNPSEFTKYMAENNVQVSKVHKRNDSYSVFKKFLSADHSLPNLDAFASKMVCLPIHQNLSIRDVVRVVSLTNAYARENHK